jgi:large subunit ribosomal protein L10
MIMKILRALNIVRIALRYGLDEIILSSSSGHTFLKIVSGLFFWRDLRASRGERLRRALEDTNYTVLNDVFVGPTLIAFSTEHPGAAARLFKEFAKTNDKFEIKGAAFEGEFIAAKDIDRLASLPTYDEAIARLMGTMKEAAAGKFVRTLAALRDKMQGEAA